MENRLKDLMRILNLKQSDVAELLGIQQSAISHIASNKRKLLPKYVDILVEKYNINREWLEGAENTFAFGTSAIEQEFLSLYSQFDPNTQKALFDLALAMLEKEKAMKKDIEE